MNIINKLTMLKSTLIVLMLILSCSACTGRYEREDKDGRTTLDWSSKVNTLNNDSTDVTGSSLEVE